jgi:hypothetical protein
VAGFSHGAWRRIFVAVFDSLFVGLLALAAWIGYDGGGRWRLGGTVLTARSAGRPVALACLVLIVRHLVVRRPSILDDLGRGARTLAGRSPDPRRRSRVGTASALALGLLALLLDAGGGRTVIAGSATAATLATVLMVGALAAMLLTRSASGAPDLPADFFAWPSGREWAWVSVGLVAATALLLHTQFAAFTSVPDFGDPLFSAWRLGWFAHELPRAPGHLFDANIYHPALRTLAYSDATLVEAVLVAPAIWLGTPLVIAYNALLVGSFVAAGLGMFALARAVTGHAGAAFLSALAFAFDPFRFSEYAHLEMQFTCWMPLAVWLLLRTLARGRPREGLATGAFVALQALSSMYYGAYLAVSLGAVTVGWIWRRGWPPRRAWTALGWGALLAIVAAALVTVPYRANRATVGDRGDGEIRAYSATARNYFISSRQSAVYGETLLDRQPDGLNLFTGTVPLVLGAAAVLPPPAPLLEPTLLGLVASVDASFGLNGTIYSWLNHVDAFHGFRVAGRFRAVVGVYLSLLVGIGVARVRILRSARIRSSILGALAVLMLVDVHPTLELRPVWLHGPGIYQQIPGEAVVADLPLLADGDSVFTYLSTFHWHPLVNGSSGFQPSWYPALAAALSTFPDDRALDALARVGTEYVVLHEAYYRDEFDRISARADAQPRLAFVATSSWDEGACRLYRLIK